VSDWTETIGFDPEALVDKIVAKGVAKRDAAKLITNLVAVNLGTSPRHFALKTALPGTGAAPAPGPPGFTRTFSHQQWIDGDSVVQASESADDRGFNWRFDRIADDLDALNLDARNLFTALEQLRTALTAALREVADELNRVNADLAFATRRLPPENIFQVDLEAAPQFLGVRELDAEKVTMWKTAQGVVVLPGVQTIGLQETVKQRLETGGLVARAGVANDQLVAAFAAGRTVADISGEFGAQPLGDGRTLAQGLAVLPPGATFASLDAAVEAINTQEQTVLKSTVGALGAVSAVTGVTSEGTPLSRVDAMTVTRAVPGLTGDVAGGLSRAGLETVGAIADLSPDELMTRLSDQGVPINRLQALELKARATIISRLDG
jgi:hypothetical protein